jgi:hypothetical protein
MGKPLRLALPTRLISTRYRPEGTRYQGSSPNLRVGKEHAT